MRTPEELEVLYAKFDNDVATKSRMLRLAIAIDQVFAVLFWNTSCDETISSQIARRQKAGTSTWFDDKMCHLLKKLEYNHCLKSIGE